MANGTLDSIHFIFPCLDQFRNVEIQDFDYWKRLIKATASGVKFILGRRLIDENVCWIHVSVDNSQIVHVFDALKNAAHDVAGKLFVTEWASLVDDHII